MISHQEIPTTVSLGLSEKFCNRLVVQTATEQDGEVPWRQVCSGVNAPERAYSLLLHEFVCVTVISDYQTTAV